MRFKVLALDYDGTIAKNDTIHPEIRNSIDEARREGIVVFLVTGRNLKDLRSKAGDLKFFNAVVAENGAVLSFPDKDRLIRLAQPPPRIFTEELLRQGIQAVIGECVVEADASHAHKILDIIHELELPLVILFNRGRLMILPQSVNKASGLQEALSTLRLSPHNAIAIGDAENDHAMLAMCEVGVAVPWSSEALKTAADVVLDGTYPETISTYIREVTSSLRLPQKRKIHQLLLGSNKDGKPLSIAVRGRNILIAGDSGSGKSWITGLICEQLILQRYSVCVIDVEGEYSSLETLPGVVVLGKENPPQFRDIEKIFRYPEASIVVELLKMSPDERFEYVLSLLELLGKLRRETGLPHRIFLDEAQYFLYGPEGLKMLDWDLAGYTFVTYQLSRLNPSILHAAEAIIMTRKSDSSEISQLHSLLGDQETVIEWQAILGNLATNEAVLLPGTEESGGRMRLFRMAQRLTSHVRHQHKYLDVPIPLEKAFVFTHKGLPTGQRAISLAEFISIVYTCATEVLKDHMRRHDFSNWISDVFRDDSLALQVRRLEMRRDLVHGVEIRQSLAKIIGEHYMVSDPILQSNI
jgi:hydroxymethylpyrimidine pyrophosphatase-like HAD family hydrolase